MKTYWLVAALVILVGSACLRGAEQAATEGAPAANPPTVVTEVREQTMPAVTLMYAETDTTRDKIGEFATKELKGMMEAMKKAGVSPTGPAIFTYEGMAGDPKKPFHLTVGFPVAAGTAAAGGYQVKKLDAFHCETVLYSGAASGIGEAFMNLFRGMPDLGFTPTEEIREYNLYWESEGSANNVLLIMAGVK